MSAIRKAVLQLIEELAARADVDDACAEHFSDIAANATSIGNDFEADRMLLLAQKHRLRALEIRNRLINLT